MISLYVAMSLDGAVAGEGDDLSWLEETGKGGLDGDYGYQAFYRSVDVVVMGRRTWSVCRDFKPWPYGDKPCVVLTRQTGLAPVANETFAAFDAEHWRARSASSHVYLCGGGEVTRQFLQHGLVDRLELAVMPTLLGEGAPLFPPGFPRSAWVLTTCQSHASGVVQLSYRRRTG